jgi:hypothetical protein
MLFTFTGQSVFFLYSQKLLTSFRIFVLKICSSRNPVRNFRSIEVFFLYLLYCLCDDSLYS